MRLARFTPGSVCLVVCLAWSAAVFAAPTAEQRKAAAEIQTILQKAGALYKANKFNEAAAAVKDAQAKSEALLAAGDAETLNLLKPSLASLEKAHALLELEGIKLPPLKKPEELVKAPMPMPAPANPNPANPANPASPAAPATGISFTRHIAPLLTGKCGRCHVNDMKGEFSMATFQSLMRGPKGARVILPGAADDSRLVQVIAEGDMPRGGGKVSQAELTTLKQWIKEGAKFDGTDQTAALASLTPPANPANPAAPPPMVARATGKETISFARDIAPHLVANCTGCHGDRQPRAMFNLTTFTGLLKGGEDGPNIIPGKPAESLLIKKLKGTAGDRMPLNLDPLPDDVIAKFEKWILEGAKFDGDRPDMKIERVAALALAKHSSHEELSKMREEQAAGHWRLGMPGIKSNIASTTNFYVLGNVGEKTLADIGKQAEEQSPKVAKLFGAPEDKPLIKGKMTLFVFDKRYDYSEFGKMVEKRDLPTSWYGHWKFDVVSAYGTVVPPKSNQFSLNTLIAQQLASAYVSSAGEVPPWFAEGAGRVAAARLDAKDPRVVAWDNDLGAAISSMQAPDDFMTAGKMGSEDAQVAAYSFVKYLMSTPAKFNSVLDNLRAGQSFDAAFGKAYGGSPVQLTTAWARKGGKR